MVMHCITTVVYMIRLPKFRRDTWPRTRQNINSDEQQCVKNSRKVLTQWPPEWRLNPHSPCYRPNTLSIRLACLPTNHSRVKCWTQCIRSCPQFRVWGLRRDRKAPNHLPVKTSIKRTVDHTVAILELDIASQRNPDHLSVEAVQPVSTIWPPQIVREDRKLHSQDQSSDEK